ncbi:carbohydrate ABC transporter permease [Devosia sp. A449]
MTMTPATIRSYTPFLRPLSKVIGFIEGKRWPFVFLIPSMVIIGIIILFPIFWGFSLSIREMHLTRPDKGQDFVGLKHFIRIATDPLFWLALGNTVKWVVGAVLGELVLGLAAALLLNRSLPGFKFLGIIMLLPWMLPNIVAAHMWAVMLDSRIGIINDILVYLGIIGQAKAWFADPSTAMWTALVVEIWHGFPFFTLLLLAGLQGIPNELYEAARCDGATRRQQFAFVTMPMLKTMIVATVILRVIALMNSPDILLILTGGGPALSTMVLSLYAYQEARLNFDFGYASALTTVMFFILLVFSYTYVRYSRIMKD